MPQAHRRTSLASRPRLPGDAVPARDRAGTSPASGPIFWPVMAEISSPLPTGPSPTVYGRVAPDGTVYVITADGEREVGSWQAGRPEEGLAYYARRFEDLSAEVTLLERRASMDPTRAAASAARLRENLATAAVVGDIGSLERRLDAIAAKAVELQQAAAAEKAEQRAAAAAEKTALIEEAERVAETNDWRKADEALRGLVDRWKAMPRLDRKTDDELWGRLSAAREQLPAPAAGALRRARREAQGVADPQGRADRRGREALDLEGVGSDHRPLPRPDDRVEGGRRRAEGRRGVALDPLQGRAGRVLPPAQRVAGRARRGPAGEHRREEGAARPRPRRSTPPKDVAGRPEAAPGHPAALGGRRSGAAGRRAGLDRRLAAVEEKVRGAGEKRFRPDPSESPLVQRLEESIAKLERRIARTRAAGQEKEAAEAEADAGHPAQLAGAGDPLRPLTLIALRADRAAPRRTVAVRRAGAAASAGRAARPRPAPARRSAPERR